MLNVKSDLHFARFKDEVPLDAMLLQFVPFFGSRNSYLLLASDQEALEFVLFGCDAGGVA